MFQKCKVDIRFSPMLTDEEICQEATKLIVADLERKTAEEQQKASEQEKEGVPQEIPVFKIYFYVIFLACLRFLVKCLIMHKDIFYSMHYY